MKLLITSMAVILYDSCATTSIQNLQELYRSHPDYADMINALLEDDPFPVKKMLPLLLPWPQGAIFLSKSDGAKLVMQLARQGLNGSSILAELARWGFSHASPGIVQFATRVDSYRQIDADFFDAVVSVIPRQRYGTSMALLRGVLKLPWSPKPLMKHAQLMIKTCLDPNTLARTCLESWIHIQGGPLRIYRISDVKWQETLLVGDETFFMKNMPTAPMPA